MLFLIAFIQRESTAIVVWVSKYVYHGDSKAIARHLRILGISDFIFSAVAIVVGILHDLFA